MLETKFSEYWNSLTFKDPYLKELLTYVFSLVQEAPRLAETEKLIELIKYYMENLNPIATQKAENLCTSATLITQLLPYDRFMASYLAKQRNIAANQGAILQYPPKNKADEVVDKYIREFENLFGSGELMQTTLLVPESFYKTLITIAEYVEGLKDVVNGIITGAEAKEKMIFETKNELAKALMAKTALQRENERLNKLLSTISRKV